MKLYNSDYINRLMLEFSSMCIYALLFGGIIYIGDFGITSEKSFAISLLLGFFAGLLDDIGRKIEEFNLDILEQIKKAERVETAMEDLEKKIKAFSEMHKGKSADDILAEMRGEEPRQEDKPTTIKGINGNDREFPNSEQKQDVSIRINPSEYINDMGGNGCYLKNTAQASAWSEKDAAMLDKVIKRLHTHSAGDEAYLDIYYWLKSLKERVQLQPKQEWSVEDYNEIETIACHLDNIGNEGMAEVLRNIRDKTIKL